MPSCQSYLRRGTHQRKLCGQLCRTHISPAVSVSKKKGARIGRAAGERYRPLKKLNQVCDPSAGAADRCHRGEAALRPLQAAPRLWSINGCGRGGRRLGTLSHCRAIFIKEAQAAFPHGFVTWANRPLSNSGQSMPARRFPIGAAAIAHKLPLITYDANEMPYGPLSLIRSTA